ncbi:MAG: serine/threonine-protein kinase [Jatrophihabitantaceae bacterium]
MSEQPIGAEIAGYRIESVIGRGGMAVVYRAEDTRLGRKVALKLLAAALSDEERFQQRFVQESRLAASLDHPNIIPIYEAGNADGLLFIAMRYVVGTDLKVALSTSGPLGLPRTVRLFEQVGDALDAAHERGLVHRDVKPGNVLLTSIHESDDHVYLTDFGLTKRASSLTGGLTGTGHFLGTIDYVAPEQIAGKSVDARTDIYALGCVLYECLTGRVPFARDDDAATLWAHLVDVPPPVSASRSDTSPALDEVINRAMAKAPEDRYSSCRDLVVDLEAAVGATASARGRPNGGGVDTAPPGKRFDEDAAEQPPRAPSDHPSLPSGTFPPELWPGEAASDQWQDEPAPAAWQAGSEGWPDQSEGWPDDVPAYYESEQAPPGRRSLGTRIAAHRWPILVALVLVAALVTAGWIYLAHSGSRNSPARPTVHYVSTAKFGSVAPFGVDRPVTWEPFDGPGVDVAMTPGGAAVAGLFFGSGSWSSVDAQLRSGPANVTGVYISESGGSLPANAAQDPANLQKFVRSALPATAAFDVGFQLRTVGGMQAYELTGRSSDPAGSGATLRFVMYAVQYQRGPATASVSVVFFAAPGTFAGQRAQFDKVLNSIVFS